MVSGEVGAGARDEGGEAGDEVVHGGAEELLESVVGFEVEGGGIVIASQQPLLYQGAGDTGGDGVEQALELGLGRSGDAVEPGRFVIECVGAVEEEHVEVRVGAGRPCVARHSSGRSRGACN